MKLFILEYYNLFQFEFLGKVEEGGTYLEGKFVWDEECKRKISKINELEEYEEEQCRIWYLDQEGYRLEDKYLFENSPWSLIQDGIREKVVKRFQSGDGSAIFALAPWFGISNEYNTKR
jgi:hypothetical protein